ncbi:UDP-N-acetylglucosamine transporter UGNT1 [Citrus sinensis]|nr:UDP-N-acetylglucosamine transporter UGNT1 [Citrus sinensis]
MASSMKSDELPVTVNDSLKRQEQPKGSAAMTKRGVYAAASYMASAVLLVMFNKAALSSYSFPCANVITLFQMFCSCSILYALRCWKIISFTVGEPQTTSNNPTTLVPLKTLVHTLPLALSYLLYMLITMEAVRGINVPMYTTLRRTTVAFTMIVEYLLTGQKHSLPVVGSVGIILLGAFLAGAWDLSFDAYGYAVVFIANICTAAYLAFISRIGSVSFSNFLASHFLAKISEKHFTYAEFVGIICTPILLFWTSFRGDLEVTMNFPLLFYPGFQVVMLLSCIMAFLINYYVFLNTTLNSALTQTICGNLKDLLTIGLGWLLFGGLPFDLFNIVGQALGFLGSCFYAYCKLQGK